MLKRIRLTNFKSFADAEIDLAPLTLLVGANASGKSNFLDALRFLQGTALGMTFDEILNGHLRGGVAVWPGIRGGTKEIGHAGAASFSLEAVWRPDLPVDPRRSLPDWKVSAPERTEHKDVSYSIGCNVNGTVALSHESLRVSHHGENSAFETEGAERGRVRVLFPPEQAEREATRADFPANMSMASQIGSASAAATPGAPNFAFLTAHWLLHAMSESFFLELRPDAMRGYGTRKRPLGLHGENLSGVLADLCESGEGRQSLVAWLAELCAPEVEDLDTSSSPSLAARPPQAHKGPMSSDRDGDPKEDLKQGLSLLWRAARKTAEDIRKDLDRTDVGKAIDDAGRELVRAATNVVGRIGVELGKIQQPPPHDGERPEHGAPPEGGEVKPPPAGPTPEDPGFRIAVDPEDDPKPR
jgi:AAA ATPase domain